MNRVETAIQKGRCVLAMGGRALQESTVLAELRRRSAIPSVVLGGEAVDPASDLNAQTLAPAIDVQGGIVVLVEPDAAMDGRALAALAVLLKKAANKPRLHVVGRSFNPFMLPMNMRLMKLDHERQRARDFMAGLPIPTATPRAQKAVAEKVTKKKGPAPRIAFEGREEELEALKELLSSPGALTLVGPRGSGRTWLIEKAIDTNGGLKRLPDFAIERGSEFDALAARLAHLSGDPQTAALLKKATPPAQLVDQLIASLNREELVGHVMVIDKLFRVQNDDGSVPNRGRLSMLIRALLTRPISPTLVFVTDRRPAFFRDGEGADLRIFEVGGLKGRELHSLFEAYGATEIDRSHMGHVWNQTEGHPVATRVFAISWRDSDNRDGLVSSKQFLKIAGNAGLGDLRKRLEKRISKLEPALAAQLIAIEHCPVPVTGSELAQIGLSRDARLKLMWTGLLDALPIGEQRTYYVNSLVAEHLPRRRDFDLLERAVHLLRKRLPSAEGIDELVLKQHINRLAVQARQMAARGRMALPDDDATLESVRGLLRSKNPRPGMARQRLVDTLRDSPGNVEALLLKAECMEIDGAGEEKIQAVFDEAAQLATPEVFHTQCGWRLRRGRKGDTDKAIDALRSGIEAFPDEGSLHRRLGGLLADKRVFDEAEAVFRKAIEIEPGAPESYSRLGEVLLAQGADRWDDAEKAIRYGLELEPDLGPHSMRLAMLLRRRAMVDLENADSLQAEAKGLLEKSIRGRRPGRAYLELALLLLESDEGLDRAAWCLGKASKQGGKNPLVQIARARVLARTGKTNEAEALLQRVLKNRGSQHLARAALAELYFSRKQVFAADRELEQAISTCPQNAPEGTIYKREKARLEALIQSGTAVEIEKTALAEANALPEQPGEVTKTTHDRGTVMRRRGSGTQTPTGAAPAEAQAAPAEAQAAPPEAETPPVVAAPVEAAPAEAQAAPPEAEAADTD